MSSFMAIPAVLVGEPRVVNILSPLLPSLLLIFSLEVELISELLHGLLMVISHLLLHLEHLLVDLVRLVLTILWDFLLKDHRADCVELTDHWLDSVHCLQLCLLEAERLLEDLLEQVLFNFINFGDQDVKNFWLLASALCLVVTDGFGCLMLARIKNSLQSADNMVFAIVGWEDWLQVGFVYVVHVVVTVSYGFGNDALDLLPLLLFGFTWHSLYVLKGEEIFTWEAFVNNF